MDIVGNLSEPNKSSLKKYSINLKNTHYISKDPLNHRGSCVGFLLVCLFGFVCLFCFFVLFCYVLLALNCFSIPRISLCWGKNACTPTHHHTSCSCSNSFLRASCSVSSSTCFCFSAWFSSRTTNPHSAARIFSRFASANSCVSRSTSARYCSTDSPRPPPSAAIAPVCPLHCRSPLFWTEQQRRAEAERCSISAPCSHGRAGAAAGWREGQKKF